MRKLVCRIIIFIFVQLIILFNLQCVSAGFSAEIQQSSTLAPQVQLKAIEPVFRQKNNSNLVAPLDGISLLEPFELLTLIATTSLFDKAQKGTFMADDFLAAIVDQRQEAGQFNRQSILQKLNELVEKGYLSCADSGRQTGEYQYKFTELGKTAADIINLKETASPVCAAEYLIAIHELSSLLTPPSLKLGQFINKIEKKTDKADLTEVKDIRNKLAGLIKDLSRLKGYSNGNITARELLELLDYREKIKRFTKEIEVNNDEELRKCNLFINGRENLRKIMDFLDDRIKVIKTGVVLLEEIKLKDFFKGAVKEDIGVYGYKYGLKFIERNISRNIELHSGGKALPIEIFKEDGFIVIEFKDNGNGFIVDEIKNKAVELGLITQEEAKGLSEEGTIDLIFRRGFSARSNKDESNGLGLYNCRYIVENYFKGIIRAENIRADDGTLKGAKFVVRLPLKNKVNKSDDFSTGALQLPVHTLPEEEEQFIAQAI